MTDIRSKNEKKRVVVVCPGRGTYPRECPGTLLETPSVLAAEAFRTALGRPGPLTLDRAAAYQSKLHVAGENASILTMACGLADWDALRSANKVEVVAVVGNSMGWYTALTVAGALSLEDGFTLVETFAQYQAGNVVGGQLVYPLVDASWGARLSPELEELLAEVPDLYFSILLGGQVVVGGSETALATAMRRLPVRKIGERDAPFLLPLHSAFHTPLLARASERARQELRLNWRAPTIPLVDGRGQIFRPKSADPGELADYTLGHQVVAAYDFGASVRTVLREYAPDHVVLLGPGGNLGGAVGQIMAFEGWAGIRGRSDFMARQAENPVLVAMNRPDQRARVV